MKDELKAFLEKQISDANLEIAKNKGETLYERLDQEYAIGYLHACDDVLGYIEKLGD